MITLLGLAGAGGPGLPRRCAGRSCSRRYDARGGPGGHAPAGRGASPLAARWLAAAVAGRPRRARGRRRRHVCRRFRRVHAAREPVPDLFPAPAERLSAAGAMVGLRLGPVGRVVKLAAPALGVASTLRDPARPRAVVRARAARFWSPTIGPHGARHRHAGAARGARFRARRCSPRPTARWRSRRLGEPRVGRVCTVAEVCASTPAHRFASRLPASVRARAAACTSRTATPARSPSSARPANPPPGRTRGAGWAEAARPDPLPPRPALRRAAGIAVVDPAHGVTRTISLPVTLSDLWLASSGRMFAPLPGIDQVAVVDVQAALGAATGRGRARRWRSRRRGRVCARRRGRRRCRSPRPPHRPTARQGAPDRARRAADDAARASVASARVQRSQH